MICPTCKTPYTGMYAVDLAKHKLRLQRENPHPEENSIWLNLQLISGAYYRAGKLNETIEWQENALKYAMEKNRFSLPHLDEILHINLTCMQRFYQEQRFQEPGLLLEALIFFEKEFPEKTKDILDLTLSVAFHFCKLHSYDLGIGLYYDSFHLVNKLHGFEKQTYTIEILFSVMKAHINAGRYTAAFEFYQIAQEASSHEMYSGHINFQQLGKLAVQLADLHIAKGSLDFALRILLDLSHMKDKPMKETFNLSFSLGKMLFELKKYTDQVRALMVSYEISQAEVNETPRRVELLLLMSLGFLGADFEKHDQFYQQALKLRKESDDEYDLESSFQWFSEQKHLLILEKLNGF